MRSAPRGELNSEGSGQGGRGDPDAGCKGPGRTGPAGEAGDTFCGGTLLPLPRAPWKDHPVCPLESGHWDKCGSKRPVRGQRTGDRTGTSRCPSSKRVTAFAGTCPAPWPGGQSRAPTWIRTWTATSPPKPCSHLRSSSSRCPPFPEESARAQRSVLLLRPTSDEGATLVPHGGDPIH